MIKENINLMNLAQRMFFFSGRVPNDRHCTCLSNKPLSYKVELATVDEGDPKAPFSIASTPMCKGGCYTFPWISLLYP